jgi:HD-GYP domain-containing protein (c-di-GMP phosphodiesterase class II)
MSFGIACFPKDADSINDLIHQADIAVYQAKLKGRNRVVCVQDVPHSIRLDTAPREERVAAPAIPTFTPRPEIPPPNHTPPAPQPPVETTETHLPLKPVPQPPSHYKVLFPLLLVLVVTSGLVLAVWGWIQGRQTDMTTMGLLIGLALLAQMPQVKNLYGESSVSVSMAVNFAAALLAGIPGITAVSAVIALVHYIQRKPLLYKTAYNWAVHVLAGTVPVFVVSLVPNPFQLPNLLWLAVLCIGTALAFYLIETGLIAAGISFSERADVLSTWRGTFQWLAPQYLGLCFMGLVLSVAYTNLYLLGVLIVLMPILMMYVSQRQYVERTAESINELKRVNQELGLANREIVAASQTIRTINDELFLTLSKIIDARDPFVSGHSAQVAVYARAIAKAMGLSEERVQNVQQAALMHDIGKIAIDENVLNKPGRLDPQEYDYVKTHAAVGASFLETSQGLRHLAPFLRYHHERWDGTGYPDGLTGEQIPLEARILAICDAVETMASDRPYRRAMSLDEILAEIERCAATQFDPKVAETFIRILEQDGARLVVNSARKVAQTKSDQEPGKHGEAGRTTSPRAADTPAEPTDLRGLVGNVAA